MIPYTEYLFKTPRSTVVVVVVVVVVVYTTNILCSLVERKQTNQLY
jgi:hypothetical protein